jgi:arylsulfate sulfotransferase
MWTTLLLACSGDEATDPPTQVVDHSGASASAETAARDLVSVEPTLEVGGPKVRLVQRLRVSTSVPTRATLVVDDGRRARRLTFPSLLQDHDLPILELTEGTPYTVTLRLESEDGESAERTLSFTTSALDLLLPELELLVNDGAEPGLRVIPVGDGDVPYVILVVDADARPVYALRTGTDTKAVTFHPGDAWWGALLWGTVTRLSVYGETLDRWAGSRDLEPGDTEVAVRALHHEAAFDDDGSFWSLHKTERLVPDYPVTVSDLSQRAPTTIDDDHVVHVAPDGTILADFSLAERLDPTRITADSLTENREDVFDWAHANAVVRVPGEDAVLVSMRHQDAVIKLDLATGNVRWILGNHDGWPAALQPLLLTPEGRGFAWQYHQHAPFPLADGRVVLFDNGNAQRTTPYSNDPVVPNYTRLVAFEVDESARTVRQVGQYVEGLPTPLYADTLGNADVLPTTGHVYGTFSYLYREGGVDNDSIGRGARSVRLIEVDLAAGTKHWDLRLSSDATVVPRGFQVDRSFVVDTLYPAGVVQEWLE